MWLHRAQPDVEFVTLQRQCVRVIDPGKLNRHDGPDFRNAVITVDGVLRRGDIEIHTNREDWHRHGHDRDANYDGVVLHVCLFDGPAREGMPTIALSMQLGTSFRDAWSGARDRRHPLACLRPSAPMQFRVRRGFSLGGAENASLDAMLALAAARRFERKFRRLALRFDALLRENEPAVAFRQLLYETMARAAGYGGNEQPFESLARAVSLRTLSTLTLAQRLERLAAAGGLTRHPAYLTPVADGGGLPQAGIPAGSRRCGRSAAGWNNAAVMPHNRIGRRLGWFAAWAVVLDEPAWWRCLLGTVRMGQCELRSYEGMFHTALSKDNPGTDRIAEIMINVLAPFLRLYGERKGDMALARAAAKLYFSVTPAPQNRHTRLFTDGFDLHCDTSARQQGMIELATEFCQSQRCTQCLYAAI
ncbi:MAG: DUF2851 family protein [Bacteroidetes bacterium]|nr:DUF2851 family protein [Bacteroidota bacterium]